MRTKIWGFKRGYRVPPQTKVEISQNLCQELFLKCDFLMGTLHPYLMSSHQEAEKYCETDVGVSGDKNGWLGHFRGVQPAIFFFSRFSKTNCLFLYRQR
jgi:hypothetical protein